MRGNPVAYRNLFRHLREILNYIEIALDTDFILEELNAALYECEATFGKRHQFATQIRNQMKYLYNKYIDKIIIFYTATDGVIDFVHTHYLDMIR